MFATVPGSSINSWDLWFIFNLRKETPVIIRVMDIGYSEHIHDKVGHLVTDNMYVLTMYILGLLSS